MTPAPPLLLAIRPQPGLSRTLAAARRAALPMEGEALFEAHALPWQPPDPADYDALLLGSGAAVRCAGEALTLFRHLPVHAVGRATAQAATDAGLTVVSTGRGDLQSLLGSLRPGRLLRLAGHAHVQVVPPPGCTVDLRVVYTMRPKPLSAGRAARLRAGGGVVLLHSAAAAAHWAAECERLALPRAKVALAALAPRVLAAAGPGWRAHAVAAAPNDAALLAATARLWQEAGGGAAA
ncbi:uroporphyrinogen-III synthase [Erythrobacteraceae bacterium CFH 75059]|uniref:uroporphyrinogen-III synthase n=1 Tax=Qipengyuania thermophila TaxID=2509361 RepID=UPI001021B96F|nr:uroporphyrinogen-III synthase [Qipengyuania thermophila]TCD06374.1 uroporphyrinogen-III synthase [Erythrobacteraceae bacterium CFH 75059]